MLDGGDGYTALKGSKVTVGQHGGELIANDAMVLLKKLGTVNAKMEGRTVIQGRITKAEYPARQATDEET